jgi:hypothetical protein
MSGGFALIATLTLMILLVMVAVGLLTLSSISLRSTGQNTARAEAEANARLALMLALGELQQLLGPDQNITAPSGIFDAEPESTEVTGLAHRHLTGVWQARNETLAQTPDYSRTQSFRRWLVSNTNDEQVKLPEFVRQGALADPVLMVDGPDNSVEGRVQGLHQPARRRRSQRQRPHRGSARRFRHAGAPRHSRARWFRGVSRQYRDQRQGDQPGYAAVGRR